MRKIRAFSGFSVIAFVHLKDGPAFDCPSSARSGRHSALDKRCRVESTTHSIGRVHGISQTATDLCEIGLSFRSFDKPLLGNSHALQEVKTVAANCTTPKDQKKPLTGPMKGGNSGSNFFQIAWISRSFYDVHR